MLSRGLRAEKHGAGSLSLRVLLGWGHPCPHPCPCWDRPVEELKVLKGDLKLVGAPNPAGFNIPPGLCQQFISTSRSRGSYF